MNIVGQISVGTAEQTVRPVAKAVALFLTYAAVWNFADV